MNPTVAEPMAKKRTKKAAQPPPPPKPAPEPEPEPSVRKPMVVQMRGSEGWKTWVEGLADQEGFTVAMLVERALRKYARDLGYPDPPRR